MKWDKLAKLAVALGVLALSGSLGAAWSWLMIQAWERGAFSWVSW